MAWRDGASSAQVPRPWSGGGAGRRHRRRRAAGLADSSRKARSCWLGGVCNGCNVAPRCGEAIARGEIAFPRCGRPIARRGITCPRCGEVFARGENTPRDGRRDLFRALRSSPRSEEPTFRSGNRELREAAPVPPACTRPSEPPPPRGASRRATTPAPKVRGGATGGGGRRFRHATARSWIHRRGTHPCTFPSLSLSRLLRAHAHARSHAPALCLRPRTCAPVHARTVHPFALAADAGAGARQAKIAARHRGAGEVTTKSARALTGTRAAARPGGWLAGGGGPAAATEMPG